MITKGKRELNIRLLTVPRIASGGCIERGEKGKDRTLDVYQNPRWYTTVLRERSMTRVVESRVARLLMGPEWHGRGIPIVPARFCVADAYRPYYVDLGFEMDSI